MHKVHITQQHKMTFTMNPFIWVIFALMALDAVREIMGASSLTGLFS
ncbi:KPN_01571 family protein [Enterobacter sp.]